MQDSRRQFLAAAAAGITGLLAGCGGNDSGTPTESTAAETDTESTATETDTESMGTDTDTESMTTETTTDEVMTGTESADPAQIVAVGDGGLSFSPDSFEISVGDTVRWEWEGSGHNVVPDSIPSESDWDGTEGGAGTTYDTGHTYSYTFETAGEYSYYCAPHQGSGMTGSFTVTQ